MDRMENRRKKDKENFTINIAQESCERACITDDQNSYITPCTISRNQSFLKSSLEILNYISSRNHPNHHQLTNPKNESPIQYLSEK